MPRFHTLQAIHHARLRTPTRLDHGPHIRHRKSPVLLAEHIRGRDVPPRGIRRHTPEYACAVRLQRRRPARRFGRGEVVVEDVARESRVCRDDVGLDVAGFSSKGTTGRSLDQR